MKARDNIIGCIYLATMVRGLTISSYYTDLKRWNIENDLSKLGINVFNLIDTYLIR